MQMKQVLSYVKVIVKLCIMLIILRHPVKIETLAKSTFSICLVSKTKNLAPIDSLSSLL